MPSLAGRPRDRDWRARRWDAVVLGSGLAGLVAACRLGRAGHSVLVVEEEAAARLHPALREPFLLRGVRDRGVLDACLRELALPLIERRRIRAREPACQVLGPGWRPDIGEAERTAAEWVAWGLAKPEEARRLTSSLLERAEEERLHWLDAPCVRAGGALARGLARAGAPRKPAAPALPHPDSPELCRVWEALVRALSHRAHDAPDDAERARLLGSLLAGGVGFEDGPPWLHGLLRRRVQSLHGDFRTLAGGFSLIDADGDPGLAVPRSGELWLGRALVLACPVSALARVLPRDDRPDFVRRLPSLRRAALHLRVRRDLVPEAMASGVVLVGGPGAPLEGGDHVALSLHRDPEAPGWWDAVARFLVDPDADPAPAARAVRGRVEELLPFAAEAGPEGLRQRRVEAPRWDDDGWLEDLPRGRTPGEARIRLQGRPPVYRLERAALAGLGLEGDLLLGWRGGDAVAAELG